MDFIYCNETGEELGVLSNYTLDTAFGSSENTFEVETDSANNVCKVDYKLYVPGTDIGGIVDYVYSNTKNGTIKYGGRTAHGILNSRCLEPVYPYAYYEIAGNVHDCLVDIFRYTGFIDTIEILEGVDFPIYSKEYGTPVFNAVNALLLANGAKLKIVWNDGKFSVQPVEAYNYATDEEFDSSQLNFEIKKYTNLPNHFICLDKEKSICLHLYTDENGGVQPYTLTNEPLQDSDYILDRRSQVVFDEKQYDTLLELTASATNNYLKLGTKPYDWDSSYSNYYKVADDSSEDDISYEQLKRNTKDLYILTKGKPWDWDWNYENYYTQSFDTSTGEYTYSAVTKEDGSEYVKVTAQPYDWLTSYTNYLIPDTENPGSYKNIVPIVEDVYTKVTKKPKNWGTDYENYYLNDGTGVIKDIKDENLGGNANYGKGWSAVSSGTKDIYELTTRKPSDWNKNWKEYYIKMSSAGGYAKAGDYWIYNKFLPWQKNKFYKKSSKSVKPNFSKVGTVYKKTTNTPIPNFATYNSKVGVYTTRTTSSATWESGKIYEKRENVDLGMTFIPNSYYMKVVDNYAEMVKTALQQIEEIYSKDELSIDLSAVQQTYDLNDIVGGIDNITGLVVNAPISKKIITIQKNIVQCTYETKK